MIVEWYARPNVFSTNSVPRKAFGHHKHELSQARRIPVVRKWNLPFKDTKEGVLDHFLYSRNSQHGPAVPDPPDQLVTVPIQRLDQLTRRSMLIAHQCVSVVTALHLLRCGAVVVEHGIP